MNRPPGARLRCRERGQAAVEYAGALLAVSIAIAALAAVFGATGLSGKLRSEVHHELCRVGIESFDRTCPGEAAAQPPSRAQVDRQALTQALSNVRLVDACAGGGSNNPEVTLDAPGSQACKVALARLNTHQLSILALLAATIQTSEPGNGGNFAYLLKLYLQNPGNAVIALSPRAQQEQGFHEQWLQKVQKTKGDLFDGFLGSLCGGYGLCLGGNVNSQSYLRAFRTSAKLGRISSTILIATGIAGVLKRAALPALGATLERLGIGAKTVEETDKAAAELEGNSGGGSAGGGGEGGGAGGGGGGGGAGGGGAGGEPGPGNWEPKNEYMPPRAAAYQEQITGRPVGTVYRVSRNGESVAFDGYRDGTLLDAKGPGYAASQRTASLTNGGVTRQRGAKRCATTPAANLKSPPERRSNGTSRNLRQCKPSRPFFGATAFAASSFATSPHDHELLSRRILGP